MKPPRANPAHVVMKYLARYLHEHPETRKKLYAAVTATTGKFCDRNTVWRHTSLNSSPALETAIVYLIFLHKAGELIPSAERGALFTYKHPQWITKK